MVVDGTVEGVLAEGRCIGVEEEGIHEWLVDIDDGL